VLHLFQHKGNIVFIMAAARKKSATKSNGTRKAKSAARKPLHVDERVKEHMQTVARLHELIGKCAELRDAGRLPATRKAFKQVERLQKALEAMEDVMQRHRPRHQ
jgi:hypothetical protein